MRSSGSGRNSGGKGNPRGGAGRQQGAGGAKGGAGANGGAGARGGAGSRGGGAAGARGAGGGAKKRTGAPRPEERTYGAPGGGRSGRGGQAPRQGRPGPARSRDYEARLEETARARQAKGDSAPRPPKTFDEPEGVRLQKVLAQAGLGSRRACEELIDAGRVEVNGKRVREQGLRVDPDRDEIKVDGLTVETQGHLFFALNKPEGVVSTMEDPDGRQCLGDYVTNRETRLFHVGRLDTETEGIILLTNHGELAHRLTHPRYGVTKTYLAAITGPIPRDLGKRLKEGIELEDGFARADSFRVVQNTGKNYLVEVALHEGRKHIVRRMLAEAGFPVDRLVRTRFGPIALGDQKPGWLRRLTNTEVGMLLREVGL
ncbi:pseudouridine synthase [Streptomyces capparidis]